jgi:hypothetical protein
MGAINNMKNNISPKARLMLGLTIIGVVGVVGATAMRLGGDKVKESIGAADLQLAPTKDQIDKDKPTDEVLFGDNTTVGELYKKDEEKRAEEATKGSASHVDGIKLKLTDAQSTEPVKKDVIQVPQKTRLQLLMEERAKKEADRTSEQKANYNKPVATMQENPWQSFIDAELRDANDYEISLSAAVAKLKTASLDVPDAKFEDNLGSQARTDMQTQQSVGSSAGYSQYLNFSDGGAGRKENQVGQAGKSPESYSSEAEDIVKDDYPSERIANQARRTSEPQGLIPVGQTYYSVLQIGVNTDEISPVRALVVDKGPLESAILVGDPARAGEKATLNFYSMSLKGKSYKINAIGVDPDTYRSGLADDVDNHVFSRYSKLALAAFVDGYANALSATQTVNNTDGSSSTITNPLPSAADQVKVGIGKVGEKMTPIFEKEFDRPPTVTVEANRSIVIMFMQEIDLQESKSAVN